MADQTGEEAEVSLSGPAAEWLRDRATDLELSEEELLQRLVAAFRTIEEGEEDHPAFATEPEIEELRDRIEALDADVAEKIEDVRDRVVQVKRETDRKAAADHEHPDVERRVETALEAARTAKTAVDDLEDHVDAGFENYEEVLEYLTDETEDLDRKMSALARVTIDLRDAVEHLAAREERRSATDSLAERANDLGIRRATCEECGESLDVALLTGPTCPSCDSTFTDVEPKSGFLGSPTLAVGDRPALEAPAVEDLDADVLADLADGEAESNGMDEGGLFGGEEDEPAEPADEATESKNEIAEQADGELGGDEWEDGGPGDEAGEPDDRSEGQQR